MGNILNDIREEKARKAKELFEREVVAGLRCALCGKSMPCEHIRKVRHTFVQLLLTDKRVRCLCYFKIAVVRV